MWQSRHSGSQCLFPRGCVNRPMDCPLSTGLSVLIWSASAFSSASLSWSKRSTDTATQLFTSLTVLTLVLSQPNKTPLSISWLSEQDGCSLFASLPVLTIGFLIFGWVCWESSLLPATSEPNSFIQSCLKEIFGAVEVIHILSRVWFLQFPSEQLSGYNKLGVYCKGWLRSIVFDRTSTLSFEQAWYQPNTQCFWCFFHALCMYRARRGASKSIFSGSLCSLSIGSTGRKNTVCRLLKFWPPGTNPELMMECKLIAHPTW